MLKNNKISLLVLLFFLLIPLVAFCEDEAVQETSDGMFYHISSNDPHRVMMPLSLAVKMLEENVNQVFFFDVDGVQAVIKDKPPVVKEGFELNSHQAITKLMEKGVGIYVCPMCLKVAGYLEADLMEGVKIMQKEVFFGFTEGRILTLDY